ncbi:hypothetical protein Pcinc_014916 [Petrolisthes cinctipes]|uniref:Uncharacterized protein n=1 Tax=Petrolisthes cinctipes TaxID=88211 RepID=A0AAE1FVY7_PETCI|nr:hypothetical protein Pcinc_014916 [Petrolisthes cinctipes]
MLRPPDTVTEANKVTDGQIRLFFENFSLCLAKDKLKEIELKEIKLEEEVSGELRKAVERATSPSLKRAFESVHTVKLDMYIQDIDLLHITTNLTVTIRPQPHRTAPHRTRTRV